MPYRIKLQHLYVVWLTVLLFITTLQDLKLFLIFGEIGRTATFLLLPVFLLFELKFLSYKDSLFWNTNKIFILFCVLYILASCLAISLWLLDGNELQALGENVVIKSIKVLLYYLLLFLLFRHCYFIMLKVGSAKLISACFFLVLLFYFVILIIEYATIPAAFSVYHASGVPYDRIRLLTAESSWTGSIVVILLAGSLWQARLTSVKTAIAGAFFITYFLLTSSKMFLIAVFLAAAVYFVVEGRKNLKLLVVMAGLALVGAGFTFPRLYDDFKNDIEKFTSVVTRTSALATGFYVGTIYPLGTGGLYYIHFINNIEAPATLIATATGGNAEEILSWGKGENADQNISPASEFGQWTIMLGIPGLLLISFLFYKLILYSKINSFLFIGMLYITITSLFTETIMTKPNVFLFFALVLASYKLSEIKAKA